MKIGITGITGKMGRSIAKLVDEDPIAQISTGLVRAGNGFDKTDIGELLGKEKSGHLITSNVDDFFFNCEAVIDFSSPALSIECANKAAQTGKILVCGTTGFSEEEKQVLSSCAKSCVIIWSSNMAVGVNLLMSLVEKVASVLRDDYDIEIVETHHRDKIDSPSGTALSLGAAAAKGRGCDLKEVGQMSRVGTNNKRKRGEIGFAALRGGDVIGDHTVVFAGNGERLELTHKASNRDVFGSGAVRAAIWGSNQKSGFYFMKDVLSQ
jgi:4-hydroxy-tetrahydrodipicolinate reductase